MPISYNTEYGGFAMDRNNHHGINLVSDGKTLAMRWNHSSFIFSGFDVIHMECQDYPARVVNLHLISRGPVKVGPASALDNLFLNANDLSVDELLKLAYQKIDARAEAEEFTQGIEVSAS